MKTKKEGEIRGRGRKKGENRGKEGDFLVTARKFGVEENCNICQQYYLQGEIRSSWGEKYIFRVYQKSKIKEEKKAVARLTCCSGKTK